ncbi:hypothetical protein QUF55_07845 [Clostridiaceae bacterium HSG29]|nr:hypothetical protein [Clostridiaceae bacterium HSG29]
MKGIKIERFKTKVECIDDGKEYEFNCYSNEEPINAGDKFIFFFAGIADVQEAVKTELYEINKNDRVRDNNSIDFVTGFWKACFKIKDTDLDLTLI